MTAKPDSYRAPELVERAYPSAARVSSSTASSPAPTPATPTVARRYTFAFDRWLPAGEAGPTNEFVWA